MTPLQQRPAARMDREGLAHIGGRVPTIVSVSDLTTARTVQRARLAQACGATAVMVLPISYWKLTEAEVVDHYKAVGAAIDIPGEGYTSFLMAGIFAQTVVFGSTYSGAAMAQDLPDFRQRCASTQ